MTLRRWDDDSGNELGRYDPTSSSSSDAEQLLGCRRVAGNEML